MTTSLLNAFYEAGDKIGHYASYAFLFLGCIILVLVMLKYLNTSDLN